MNSLFFILILNFIVLKADYKLQFVIDFRVCPSCSDIALLDLSNKLQERFPNIKQEALILADDIRELKPIIKKFRNVKFYRDSNNLFNDFYKNNEIPALFLLNDNNEILLSFNNILKNRIDYEKINNFIKLNDFVRLNENEDNLIMFANSGSENVDGSKICLFDYLNFRISEFDTRDGNLLNEIIINDTIPLIFRHNFNDYEWDSYYSEDPNFGVKIQNAFYDKKDNLILTGFCVGDIESKTITMLDDNSRLDTIIEFKGIPKDFILVKKNENVEIDSFNNSSYAQLKTRYFKNNVLITSIFPTLEQSNNLDSNYIFKFIDIISKNENVDINLRSLKENKVNLRKPVEQILQAHSVYNFKDDNLIFLNSYNNLFFIKQNQKLKEISPKGTLKDVFKRDQEYDSESFIDSSRIQNFNKYFVHSITFGDDNIFYIILYNYNQGVTLDIILQKYYLDKGFQKEVKIDLSSFDDEFITIAPIQFNSCKILTKWKKDRWKIMDLSKFIE